MGGGNAPPTLPAAERASATRAPDELCEAPCSSDQDCAAYPVPEGKERACRNCRCAVIPLRCSISRPCNPDLPRCDPQGLCTKCENERDCLGRLDGNLACDVTTGACVSTCDPSNLVLGATDGPDVCKYGEYCAVDASSPPTCKPVPDKWCASVTAGSGYQWDKSLRGPVITSFVGGISPHTGATGVSPVGARQSRPPCPFQRPAVWSYGDATELRAKIRFRDPVLGALRDASFVRNPPPSGRREEP